MIAVNWPHHLFVNNRQVHLFHVENGQVTEIWQFVGDGHAAEAFWS
jgi:hypothetical protein